MSRDYIYRYIYFNMYSQTTTDYTPSICELSSTRSLSLCLFRFAMMKGLSHIGCRPHFFLHVFHDVEVRGRSPSVNGVSLCRA